LPLSGAARVRRAAQSLVALERMTDGSAALGVCGKHLEAELDTLHAWYVAFGDALVRQGAVPPPHLAIATGGARSSTVRPRQPAATTTVRNTPP
jgi:hypothetical protein